MFIQDVPLSLGDLYATLQPTREKNIRGITGPAANTPESYHAISGQTSGSDRHTCRTGASLRQRVASMDRQGRLRAESAARSVNSSLIIAVNPLSAGASVDAGPDLKVDAVLNRAAVTVGEDREHHARMVTVGAEPVRVRSIKRIIKRRNAHDRCPGERAG